jgi:hypothetical protein
LSTNKAMSSSTTKDSSSSGTSLLLQQDLLETTQKVEASLQQAILEHVSSSEFSPAQGLDFLDVKNSLLLSYLIELVYDFRNRLTQQQEENGNQNRRHAGRDEASLHRLIVMRTVLDKMRGLDKKLRYQVRKKASSWRSAYIYIFLLLASLYSLSSNLLLTCTKNKL